MLKKLLCILISWNLRGVLSVYQALLVVLVNHCLYTAGNRRHIFHKNNKFVGISAQTYLYASLAANNYCAST